jgi:sialate O-acetylesterase
MKGRSSLVAAVIAGAWLAGGTAVGGALEVGRLVSDGMVIQRGVAVPILGSAPPGANVVVTIGGTRYSARADASGRFRVTLAPMEAGGPHELTLAAGGERVTVRDVLIGDVWVCSGQSNMEWVVADSLDGEREVASAHDPGIRRFKVPHSWAWAPAAELPGGAWERADPEHAGSFTAVGYFFARELRRRVNVPIGLIDASWGGSRIEPWMRAAALALDDAGVRALATSEETYERGTLAALRARVGPLPDRDGGIVDGRAPWADPALDDSAWGRMKLPTHWEDAGLPGLDGVVWFRTSLELTAAEAASPATLDLGPVDDSDITWVNGLEVGHTVLAWNRPRVYPLPAGTLRAGRNVIAVRVEDTGGGGGIWGDPASLAVELAGATRPLAGEWRFKLGVATVSLEGHKNQVPTVLYNAMVHPLLAYPIKGVLWYQGESNADPADAFVYRDRFRALITDWRAGWGLGDVPFLWVQLASYLPTKTEPAESSWAVLRESQSAALSLPRTGQAVAIDIGDTNDIHPRNKQEVGRRLALAARKVAYGDNVEFSGPTYRHHEVRDGRVVITFDHVGAGLVARGEAGGGLRGFAIAGADRKFVWAEATIGDGHLVVWSGKVPVPVAVRYAWADNPAGANLFNAEGLPAAPFRTDGW